MPDVTIRSDDGRGEFAAYLSLPPSSRRRPGLIAMQQIFGVNPEMRGFTDDFAACGYLAICPDLFWRQEPGVQISPGAPGGFERAVAYGRGFDVGKGVEDLRSTLAWLRRHPACNGKVGTVGYCLGGLMAYLMAVRSDTECNVGYFGVGIERYIAEAWMLKRPLMLHIPEKDRHVPREAQAIVRQALEGRAKLYTYPEADHAFNRVGAGTYDAEVTALAYDRTATFLRRYLDTGG
jgi:carboxymethylenebutenolidase